MYDLPHHKENDPAVVREFIEQHPFALLVGSDDQNRPVATQAPVFIEKRDGVQFLSGHIMRRTDHCRAFEQNPNVLAVFSSPHTYVSATWYSNPSMASTWDYISVHAHGLLRFLDDDGLAEVLQKTSLHFEGGNRESPTVFENLPQDFTDRMMPAIVGFEIEVQELKNVFKLSQNRDPKSRDNIIERLEAQDADARYIAAEMRKRR